MDVSAMARFSSYLYFGLKTVHFCLRFLEPSTFDLTFWNSPLLFTLSGTVYFWFDFLKQSTFQSESLLYLVLGCVWNSIVTFQITPFRSTIQLNYSRDDSMDWWRHRKENLKWDVLILKPSYWFSSLNSESEEFKNHNFIFWDDLSGLFSHLIMSDTPIPRSANLWSWKVAERIPKSDLVGIID